MASAAQIRANRANAQRSTGPRSEAGKDVTRFNALTHGLAAEKLVIRGENPEDLQALRTQLRADYAPANEVEAMLVEEVAQCWWRLQRARAQENRFIHVSTFAKPFNPDDLGPILRYMTSVERAWHRAISQLRATQNDRLKRELPATDPATSAQPEAETKVMAVGSVPQNDTEPSASTPANPELAQAILSTHPFPVNVDVIRRKLDRQIQPVEADLARAQTAAGA